MKIKNIFYCIIVVLFLSSCEDPVPKDYIPSNIVEALLIVNEPIRNIKILKSQSLFDEFSYDSSLVTDAEVYIIDDNNNILELKFRHSDIMGESGYYYPDTSYLVKKNTNYKLKIILGDSTVIKGETTTPDTIYWLASCSDFMQYPDDPYNLTVIDSIQWASKAPLATYYLFTVNCLDTLNYGRYLTSPTDELNERIYSKYEIPDKYYRETNTAMFIPATKIPVAWDYLKWFGLHELSVWLPDMNYRSWNMMLFMSSNINDRFSSIDGASGFFGSACVCRDTTFIIKNKNNQLH